jgi:hypothetical protein
MFGGADREQCHFADVAVGTFHAETNKSTWNKIEANGDVPVPRGGHAMAPYGRFVFLFGGLDFAEEAVYNDLYVLDTGTS